jgi:RNA-directed DNA polymerase
METHMQEISNLPPAVVRARAQALRTPEELAALLGVDARKLVYYAEHANSSYTTFTVPKKSGGARQITAPVRNLKAIQRALNELLQAMYEPGPWAHGFVAERSIVTNAFQHTGRQLILNIDLLDFFPSITAKRVCTMLESAPYRMDEALARAIARLCCADDRLPQGAPTSPVLSNMVCLPMDLALDQLALDHGCRYTRYADDITFSTIQETFPDELASLSNNPRSVTIGPALSSLLYEHGFALNTRKVRVRTPGERQQVTGLTVNEKPNVPRAFIRQIRAMLYAWETYGCDAAEGAFMLHYDRRRRFRRDVSFPAVVSGKISFVGMVRGNGDPLYRRLQHKYEELSARQGGSTQLHQ